MKICCSRLPVSLTHATAGCTLARTELLLFLQLHADTCAHAGGFVYFTGPKQNGKRVQLVPYRREHVLTYHGWMQDPWIRGIVIRQPALILPPCLSVPHEEWMLSAMYSSGACTLTRGMLQN